MLLPEFRPDDQIVVSWVLGPVSHDFLCPKTFFQSELYRFHMTENSMYIVNWVVPSKEIFVQLCKFSYFAQMNQLGLAQCLKAYRISVCVVFFLNKEWVPDHFC